MKLLDKYPRQTALFIFGLMLLVCYMLALFYRLPVDTLEGLLWAIGGGLIAELTGARHGGQHIDVKNIDRATMNTKGGE
jgi:hypothetical protein